MLGESSWWMIKRRSPKPRRYKALSFYSAEAALTTCDAEISDLVMPGRNGVDMAILIRERLSLSGNTAKGITSAMRW